MYTVRYKDIKNLLILSHVIIWPSHDVYHLLTEEFSFSLYLTLGWFDAKHTVRQISIQTFKDQRDRQQAN